MRLRKYFALAAALLMMGCATVDGIGQDISGGARTVRNWF